MQFYDVSQQSLAQPGGSSVVEEYIPLWMADGTTVGLQNQALGTYFLCDGASSASSPSSATKLHTLNTNWNPSQSFAFEVTGFVNNGSYTFTAQLWDMTTNTVVTGSSITTTSTTDVVLRSGKFTLTPGHSYGVAFNSSNSNANAYITDASLIVFGS